KAAEEAALHAEMLGVQAAYIAETAKPSKTWFDSAVDGINRLVRPIVTFGVIAMLVWSVVDPATFTVSMQALQLVPEWLWGVWGTVLVFWFGNRAINEVMRNRAAPQVQKAVVNTAKAVTEKVAQ